LYEGTGNTEAQKDLSELCKRRLTIKHDLTTENPEDGANGSGTYVGFLVVLIAISILMIVLWLSLGMVYLQRKCCKPMHQLKETQGRVTLPLP
jgi:hypothetical protein